jgi:TonB family protein
METACSSSDPHSTVDLWLAAAPSDRFCLFELCRHAESAVMLSERSESKHPYPTEMPRIRTRANGRAFRDVLPSGRQEATLKTIRFASALALIIVVSLATSAQQRPKTAAESIGQSWSYLEQTFVPLADAMPESKYDFVPKQGEFQGARSFAQQVKHVACANFAFAKEIRGEQPPPDCENGGPDPAKTKADLMKYLRESFRYAGDTFNSITPQNMLEPVDGRYGGPSTRLGIAFVAVWHASDHYGQLVEYLRMNGIVPPASRPATTAAEAEPQKPMRVRVSQGTMRPVRSGFPEYPLEARIARRAGIVTLHVVIGTDGDVQEVSQVSGDPTLGKAAAAAVKQWKYKPMTANGKPVEVETDVVVNFDVR